MKPKYKLRMEGLLAFILVLTVFLPFPPAAEDRAEPAPSEIEGVGIDEKLDQPIPLDLAFQNERNQTVHLQDFFTEDKPVILTLVYFQCPMLCNVILEGLVESLNDVSLKAGKDFQIVSVSFNPLETPVIAQAWKQKYLTQYNFPAENGWHFLTGKKEQIAQLTDAAGFRYKWISARQEYAHAAVVMILTPDGKLSRYLYGVMYDPGTLRLSLVEASEGKIGSTLDRFLLTCYHYDESSGRYAPLAMNIMRLGGFFTLIVLGAVLATFWLREHRRTHPNIKGAQT